MIYRFMVFMMILISSQVMAANDYYQFGSEVNKNRFQALTTELRCLVCQNQNIAESNAGLAADLRAEIYQQINRGQSNQQIIDYLVARYGNFILYKPPLNSATIFLWFGPLLLLIMGITFLLRYVQKTRIE